MMKKIFAFFFILAYIISISGCCMMTDQEIDHKPSVPNQTDPFTDSATEPLTEPAAEPATEPLTEPAVPPETIPEHSDLYIPGLCVEDVITYFNEVCLDAEFVMGGDPNFLQKWVAPIRYQLNGNYTQEDLDILYQFTQWLNTIEGFPGIYEAEIDDMVNLQIHFCTQQDMINILGENFSFLDGGVTFWYDGADQIYDATICYRTDLDQYLRNSVILEEIYNGLGPVQDTTLRADSIIYSEFSQPQSLTEIDELLLKLFYHPQMQCGMTAVECERVIRQLYY